MPLALSAITKRFIPLKLIETSVFSPKEVSFIIGIIAYTIKVFAMWAKAQYNLCEGSVSST